MRRAGVPYWVSVVLVSTRSLCVWNWSIDLTCCISGPMVYGICFCPVSRKEDLKNSKVAGWLQSKYWPELWFGGNLQRFLACCLDSKTLTEAERRTCFWSSTRQRFRRLGLQVLSPNTISTACCRGTRFQCMHAKAGNYSQRAFNLLCFYIQSKYNLNALSHDAAIGLVQYALDSGVQLKEVQHLYDRPQIWWWSRYVFLLFLYYWTCFSNLSGVCGYCGSCREVSGEALPAVPGGGGHRPSQADSLFPIVSAASICAKVRWRGGWYRGKSAIRGKISAKGGRTPDASRLGQLEESHHQMRTIYTNKWPEVC